MKILSLILLSLALDASSTKSTAQIPPLIPLPAEIKKDSGEFVFTADTKIILKGDAAKAKKSCDLFLEIFRRGSGLNIGYASSGASAIIVEIDPFVKHAEGYRLKVTLQNITIQAQTPVGVFYAFQTLRQLLPPELESASGIADRLPKVPSVEINDAPRFSYRGLMFDAARHFFSVDFLKRYIDLMAGYKYNYLHLHLTDDQGWRIEINEYPKLKQVSAWRKETLVGHLDDKPWRYDGIRYGGYYKQSELKELVKYAADRHITIVPEIDMPGHATAVLAAYPELSCTGVSFETAREWGVYKNIYCPKEETFLFLENILTEVMNIFPGKYIHLGGDECVKDQWKESEYCRNLMTQNSLQTYEQLQTWFIRRIASFVNARGRKIIGWDEILDGGDIPGSIIMSWRGEQGGTAAAKKGHDAIMTPHRYCYFDFYQWRKREEEPLSIGGYLPLSMVYMYNPVPKDLTEKQAEHILGAQGNLWTEYITDERHAEYMAYPRACALAETVWTPTELKSYDDFLSRMREHAKRLDAMNVNYARHFLGK